MNKTNNPLGQLIQRVRNNAGLSLKDLEKISKMKDSQVSRYENGKTSLKEETALSLLKFCDIPHSEAIRMIAIAQIEYARTKMTDEEILKDALEIINDPKYSELLNKIQE